MIIHDVQQGTEAWLQLRSGIPTASNFDKIFTKSKKKSESQEPYMFALLAERMMGHPRFEFMSAHMQRGVELEAKAVRKFEMEKNVDTYPIGFITNDAKTIGASPDRGIGAGADDDELLEVKVPKDETHAMYLLGSGSVFDKYKVQASGQLWVANRSATSVISFHPEMPSAIVRTERDEPFIRLLEEAVLEFSAKLEKMAAELAERGWLAKPKEPASEYKFSAETDLAFQKWNAGMSN